MSDNTKIILDFYYRTIWAEFTFFDAVYEDYIIHLIGTAGLNALVNHGLLESCGTVDGRKLYSLDKRGYTL